MNKMKSELTGTERLTFGQRLKSSESTYLLIGLIIYLVAVSIVAPNFATPYNFSIVMEQLAVPGIMAVGHVYGYDLGRDRPFGGAATIFFCMHYGVCCKRFRNCASRYFDRRCDMYLGKLWHGPFDLPYKNGAIHRIARIYDDIQRTCVYYDQWRRISDSRKNGICNGHPFV